MSACRAIKRHRDVTHQQRQILQSSDRRELLTNCVGYFWETPKTVSYMSARFFLALSISRIRSVRSLEMQLGHFIELLRLGRNDLVCLRNTIPALMILLDKDQAFYNFLRWWNATPSQTLYGDYSEVRTEADTPFLDIHNADVFEDIDIFLPGACKNCTRGNNLCHLVFLTFLKTKVLLDLERLEASSASLSGKFPRKVLDRIQRYVPRSSTVASNRALMDEGPRSAMIDQLRAQIGVLYEVIDSASPFFWKALVTTYQSLPVSPALNVMAGSLDEVVLVLGWTRDAWVETPGAIDMIESKIGGRFEVI